MFNKKIQKKTKESQIEKKVTQYAKQAGWLSYKWVSSNEAKKPKLSRDMGE